MTPADSRIPSECLGCPAGVISPSQRTWRDGGESRHGLIGGMAAAAVVVATTVGVGVEAVVVESISMHFEASHKSGLPDKDVKTMCLKYAELEKSLGEIDRARAIYVFSPSLQIHDLIPISGTNGMNLRYGCGHPIMFIRMPNEGRKVNANHDNIELPNDVESDDDERVEIAQKNIPTAVFGDLVQKVEETDNEQTRK
ncbi:hypothetical protein HHK36_018252 [Tetracentron sinense]|uniref:Pre-mRNA-splicing factor Syf1/CRNKL1-like C-terminal HAT-repeats domain-containing protein n=1 Tax=Tetracentron sinense TaxID=13715 RepID=A0A835DAN4_TETSI|nr:hypothetical protein HHK36_018252 [Tetracentron sinense]